MSGRRLQNKNAKDLVAQILRAYPDAVIEINSLGHLKVTGPGGTAIMPGKPKLPAKSRVRLAKFAGIFI